MISHLFSKSGLLIRRGDKVRSILSGKVGEVVGFVGGHSQVCVLFEDSPEGTYKPVAPDTLEHVCSCSSTLPNDPVSHGIGCPLSHRP